MATLTLYTVRMADFKSLAAWNAFLDAAKFSKDDRPTKITGTRRAFDVPLFLLEQRMGAVAIRGGRGSAARLKTYARAISTLRKILEGN